MKVVGDAAVDALLAAGGSDAVLAALDRSGLDMFTQRKLPSMSTKPFGGIGFDAKHNTWEPLEHLAGCEDLIADMKERKKQRDAELEAAAQAKKAEQEEAAAAAAAKKAAEQAAARTAQQNAGNADVAAGAMADASADA